ncbi:MAG TPA: hypothetical protein VHJ17_10550 [Thermomonospora sp.]|nr:hypothetical protein [Thermomonospora sp.]
MVWGDLTHPAVPAPAKSTALEGRVAGAAVKVADAVGRRGGSAARYVPSAGACYPYETLLCTRDLRASAVLDLARRRLVVRAADRFPLEDEEYVCVLVGRPWLSMRKYGARGFLYHLIDSGHALLNLGLLDTAGPLGTVEVSHLHGEALAAGVVTAGPPYRPGGWRLITTDGAQLQTGRSEFEQWAMDLCPDGPPRPVPFDVLGEPVLGLAAEIPRRGRRARSPCPAAVAGSPNGSPRASSWRARRWTGCGWRPRASISSTAPTSTATCWPGWPGRST